MRRVVTRLGRENQQLRAKLPANAAPLLLSSIAGGEQLAVAKSDNPGTGSDSSTVTAEESLIEAAPAASSKRRLPLSSEGAPGSLHDFSNSVLSDMGVLDNDDCDTGTEP